MPIDRETSAWIEQVEYRLDEANELEAADLVPARSIIDLFGRRKGDFIRDFAE
jgi:hypothetical protein